MLSLNDGKPVAVISGAYPMIKFRGLDMEIDGEGGLGILRGDGQHYIFQITNNNVVILGDGLTLMGGKGGVFVSESEFFMVGGTITQNTVPDGSGGGVYVINGKFKMVTRDDARSDDKIDIGPGTGGSIRNNHADALAGGGVYLAQGGLLTMTYGTISDNQAAFGGGVSVGAGGSFSAQFIMSKSKDGTVEPTIGGNTATIAGGGVYVGAGSEVIFDKSGGNLLSTNKVLHDGVSASGYGFAVAVGSTDINSPTQIAKFRDSNSAANNRLYAKYILEIVNGEVIRGTWNYNATESNW
jgi:hypothetical protein